MKHYPDFDPNIHIAVIQMNEEQFRAKRPDMGKDNIVHLKAGDFKVRWQERVNPRTNLREQMTLLIPMEQIIRRN